VIPQFYQDSWLKLVDAIASLIEQDSQFVFDALDGKASSEDVNGNGVAHDINYRDEPVAFFFVLFGIAFEALVGRPGVDSLATKEQTLEILLALKKILHPSVCGHAIYQEAIFSETMDLFDRLVLTEGLAVQSATTDIAKSLCVEHPTARSKSGAQGENLTEDIDQLFELTRLMVLVLARLLPNVVDKKTMGMSANRLFSLLKWGCADLELSSPSPPLGRGCQPCSSFFGRLGTRRRSISCSHTNGSLRFNSPHLHQ